MDKKAQSSKLKVFFLKANNLDVQALHLTTATEMYNYLKNITVLSLNIS